MQHIDNGAPSSETFSPLIARGFEIVDFAVSVGARTVQAVIASPPKDRLHPDPALLLTVGGPRSHFLPPCHQPAEHFLTRGHRVVSFPVQCMPEGAGLEEFRDMVLLGLDPSLEFIEEARAVLRFCVEQEWTKPTRIVVTGISRYGYLAMRLMAADANLNIGGGFAPVTDWACLSEFAGNVNQKAVFALQLSRFVERLRGKTVYLGIGDHDERVSTLSCRQFANDLIAANHKAGLGTDLVNLFITSDEGHTCGEACFERGMNFLLNTAIKTDRK